MGKMGSGRSNMINKLTGMQPEDRADELVSTSCTKDVCAYAHYHSGRRFILVDTPGFNQKKKQSDVFCEIARWLKETYQHSVKLTGVVYTYNIRDGGNFSTDMQSLQLLIDLCGRDAADRVRLVMTMCDEVEHREVDNAERTLRTQWQSFIQTGARVKRFDNTSETAWEIVRDLGNEKKTLLLQEELVHMGKALGGDHRWKAPLAEGTSYFLRLVKTEVWATL
ncbi:P-loop containing nucleoside triphosphate hydrolase protein, partial [Pisolithus marmoratus]